MKPEEILERSRTVRDNMGGTSPRPQPKSKRNILGRVLDRGEAEDVDDRVQ